MKKIILFILFFASSGSIYAQYQPGLQDEIYLGPLDIFAHTSLINGWGNTHGTPDYFPTYLSMWRNKVGATDLGEGVFRLYDIRPKMRYQFAFQFRDYHIPSPHLKAGISIFLSHIVSPCPSCSFGEPTPTITPKRPIYNSTTLTHTSSPFLIHKTFETFNNEHWKSVAVMPIVIDSSSDMYGDRIILNLDCLYILECSIAGDTTYCQAVIPSGNLDNHHNIDIGSSFCGLSALTKNTPSQSTKITGRGHIEVKDNAEFSVNSGKVFELEIDPVLKCQSQWDTLAITDMYPQRSLCTQGQHRPFGAFEKVENPGKELVVYPNPAQNIIHISFVLPGSSRQCNLRILDMTGRVLTQKQYSDLRPGDQYFTIPIDQLGNGNYTVEIITNEGRVYSIFTVTK